MPYARFLGLTLSITDAGGLRARMPYAEHLVGNPGVPALHGGTLGSVMELLAQLMVLWEVTPIVRPRTITLTSDFLRPALLEDTFAEGEFLRVGRRVASVQLRVWQGEDRLVASGRAHLMIGG